MTYRRKHASRLWVTATLIIGAFLSPAAAQDIRGIEKCTAEAQMERRTGCLQANVEFLHQALVTPSPATLRPAGRKSPRSNPLSQSSTVRWRN